MIKNILLYGLAAFGAFKAYEASPLKFDPAFRGQRNMGSLHEALMWEMNGHPEQTRIGARNRRR